jgi:hypothetical protein
MFHMHTLLLVVLTILGLAGVFIVIPSFLRTCLLKRRKSKMIVRRSVKGVWIERRQTFFRIMFCAKFSSGLEKSPLRHY